MWAPDQRFCVIRSMGKQWPVGFMTLGSFTDARGFDQRPPWCGGPCTPTNTQGTLAMMSVMTIRWDNSVIRLHSKVWYVKAVTEWIISKTVHLRPLTTDPSTEASQHRKYLLTTTHCLAPVDCVAVSTWHKDKWECDTTSVQFDAIKRNQTMGCCELIFPMLRGLCGWSYVRSVLQQTALEIILYLAALLRIDLLVRFTVTLRSKTSFTVYA